MEHPREGGRVTQADREAFRKQIEGWVVHYNVAAVNVTHLLATHVTSPVRYVQIDTEGFDDRILAQLPLEDSADGVCAPHVGGGGGAGTFQPDAIVFEYVLLGKERVDAAIARLQAHGYETCSELQNIVARRKRMGTPSRS